jgi:hypothetical protein
MKRLRAACLLGAIAARAASAAEAYNYWIQPCTEDVALRSGCEAADPELARWVLPQNENVLFCKVEMSYSRIA